MVKNFRAKNENVDELVEAFTKIMPQKIRMSMNLSHPNNFLVNTPKERVLVELK